MYEALIFVQVVSGKKIEKEEKKEIRELSEEERQRVMASDDFQKFFERTARVMERALADDVIH